MLLGYHIGSSSCVYENFVFLQKNIQNMIKKISIKNYKSIVDDEIELGRVNVFIGENGAGKSNILEAVGMFSAAKQPGKSSTERLFNKGIRVTKPSLMFNSFKNKKISESILVNLHVDINKKIVKYEYNLIPSEIDDITTKWETKEERIATGEFFEKIDDFINKFSDNYLQGVNKDDKQKYEKQLQKGIDDFVSTLPEKLEIPVKTPEEKMTEEVNHRISSYQIYTLSTPALRGITKDSRKQPLGLNGENLDALLSTFNDEEWQLLMDYSHFISWLEKPLIDEKDILKYEGHKLGRSTSRLYFVDQFMRKNNNTFAAENANEGALYVLFYLALFISKKTPSFFAIDNIETALNPKICRALIESITELAEKTNKQVLITTHNPAVLDGINLNDDNERLFVVSRNNEGHTKTKRIKFKPGGNQQKRKLSEYWMRGVLGGLPNNFI